jgi:DNA-binding GntR family transcriptional regulator
MSKPDVVPMLRNLNLPDDRQAIPRLHAYIRAAIIDGTLPPGMKLSQVALSHQLGVSRTPLREVLRMLQEESLVESEPNQRMRVADVHPEMLDTDYACRILIETLALSLTVDALSELEIGRAAEHVIRMEVAINAEDIEGWFLAHGHFHRLLTSKADESLLRQLRTYSDRSIRYLRLYTRELGDWQRSRHPEHIAIYTAIADHDTDLAVRRLALHLAGVAGHIIAARDPNYVGKSVQRALRLVGAAEIAPSMPSEQIQDSTPYLALNNVALA